MRMFKMPFRQPVSTPFLAVTASNLNVMGGVDMVRHLWVLILDLMGEFCPKANQLIVVCPKHIALSLQFIARSSTPDCLFYAKKLDSYLIMNYLSLSKDKEPVF